MPSYLGNWDSGTTPILGHPLERQARIAPTAGMPQYPMNPWMELGAGFMEPFGSAIDARDFVEGYRQGDPLQMGIAGASLALPFIGGLGGMVKAYHGTPHRFDKFDAAHIGSGEGAQAYGHGLYFAENPKIAGHYRDKLGTRGGFTIDGRAVGESQVAHWEDALNAASEGPEALEQFIKTTEAQADSIVDEMNRGLRSMDDPSHLNVLDVLDAAKNLRGKDVQASKPTFYSVDIDVEPEDLLDLEKSVNDQPDKVKAALLKMNEKLQLGQFTKQTSDVADELELIVDNDSDLYHSTTLRRMIDRYRKDPRDKGVRKYIESKFSGYAFDGDFLGDLETKYEASREIKDWMTGDEALSNIRNALGSDSEASKALSEAGIPGLRYLDAGSRASGEGSRNVVIFPGEEGRITITDRK
jgi:hypothetical protein